MLQTLFDSQMNTEIYITLPKTQKVFLFLLETLDIILLHSHGQINAIQNDVLLAEIKEYISCSLASH